MNKIIPFEIVQTDSLGQGVSKKNDEVVFIPKTLPEETGQAEIFKQSKGVSFALVKNLETTSPKRITPDCPHFNECNGCHFLHTDYKTELEYKKKSLAWLFKKFENFQMNVIPANNRFHYRNRIQLHYDKSTSALGLLSPTQPIVPVTDCMIILPELKEKIQELYSNNSWLRLVDDEKDQGHIELYYLKGKISLNVNKNYAHGGFTQVNSEMNTVLQNLIGEIVNKKFPEKPRILDLFSGNGNLTKGLKNASITGIDSSAFSQAHNFFKADLYKSKTLPAFLEEKTRKEFDLIMLDPPRSGFKFLKNWGDCFMPKAIIYVSCKPQILTRDLSSIADMYALSELHLVDLFPGTYHFETIAVLNLK
jgi:23S rRNA (uracil1939-C5)-methyltransferase